MKLMPSDTFGAGKLQASINAFQIGWKVRFYEDAALMILEVSVSDLITSPKMYKTYSSTSALFESYTKPNNIAFVGDLVSLCIQK